MKIPSHIVAHLPYLAAVARHGGFTAAADALGLSQSAISYQIRTLEDRLGLKLIVRQSGSQSRLTAAGEALVADFQVLEQRLALTLEDMGGPEPRGQLRLSAPVDFGSRILPHVLAELEARAPKLRVELQVSDALVDLERDPVDVAIRSAPKGDSLVHRPLARARKLMVASPAYLARHGAPGSAADLAAHRLLTRAPSWSPSWESLLAAHGLGLPDIPGCRPLGNSFALAEGALAGLGIALLPAFLVTEALASGRLVPVLGPLCADQTTLFHLSHLPLPQLTRRVAALRDAVAAVLGRAPFSDAFAGSDAAA